MKLLIIFTTEFNNDGITNNVMNYYKYLDKSGMEIDFVIPNSPAEKYKKIVEDNNGKFYVLELRSRRPYTYYRKLKSIISKNKYDIVHAHGNSCTLAIEMLAAKKSNVKVRIAHSRNTMCTHNVVNRVLRDIFEFSYTTGFACGVEAGKWLFKKRPFTVITNGNDINKFKYNEKSRVEYRRMLHLAGKKVIGHVGGFYHQKNHKFLIEVFNEVLKLDNNYILCLIGDGDLKEKIKKIVNEYKISDKVIFPGFVDDVNNYLQAMDVMVLPSLYEGLPNVLVEWQISGLPSIVASTITKETKLTDLVQYLKLDDGAKAWAKEICATNINNRFDKAQKAILDIKKAGFDIEENAKKLKEIYTDLLK